MSRDPTHRVSDILGMTVTFSDGSSAGMISDLRVLAEAGIAGYANLTVEGLVITQRGTGALLGYDRRAEQGPALVRGIVRLLHRGAGYAAWSDVATIDWTHKSLTLDTRALAPLADA